jgi:hypothetical protein
MPRGVRSCTAGGHSHRRLLYQKLRQWRIGSAWCFRRETPVRLLSFAITILSVAATLNAADFTGTWKVDPAKSKFGGEVIKAIKIEQAGQSIIVHITFDLGNMQEELTETCDGKEHPRVVKGVNAEGYTDICKQLNPTTISVTNKEHGKIIAENTFALSSGHNVLTHTRTGQNAHLLIAVKE